jgi:hypothetical protein
MAAEGDEGTPRDRDRSKGPKDSEFYEIPPDLREEFDMLMSSPRKEEEEAPKFEAGTRAEMARRRYARLSIVFAVLGGVLLFLGPVLALAFGFLAKKKAREAGRGASGEGDLSTLGIFLGFLMLPVNVVTLVLLLP